MDKEIHKKTKTTKIQVKEMKVMKVRVKNHQKNNLNKNKIKF